jgi:hypothetical protein
MARVTCAGRCEIWGAALLCLTSCLAFLPTARAKPGDGGAPARPPVDAPAMDAAAEQRREQILKANGPQVEQMTKHWEAQLRGILWAELDRVRRCCGDLPPDARRAIVGAANKSLATAARQYTEMQFGARPQQPLDAVALLHASIAAALKPVASAEVFAAYEAEESARQGRMDRAVARSIVAALDERLLLSETQREAIAADVEKQWQPAWRVQAQFLNTQLPRPAPDFAEKCISSQLDDRQRAEWKAWCQQASASRFGAHGHVNWPGQSGLDVNAVQPDPWWTP